MGEAKVEIACTFEDMHPYGCEVVDMPCCHCERAITPEHHPNLCYLCQMDRADLTEDEMLQWEAAPVTDERALNRWRRAVKGW